MYNDSTTMKVILKLNSENDVNGKTISKISESTFLSGGNNLTNK